MRPYLDLMRRILESGTAKGNRTGTRSRFGEQLGVDLSAGLPVVIGKRSALGRDERRAAVAPARGRDRALPISGQQLQARPWPPSARLGTDGRRIDQTGTPIELIRGTPHPRPVVANAGYAGQLEPTDLIRHPVQSRPSPMAGFPPALGATPTQHGVGR